MKTTFFIFIMFIYNIISFSQCPSIVNLQSQQEIINFKNTYNHCPRITDLLLSNDVSDLTPLYNLFDTISFKISIENTQLEFIDLTQFIANPVGIFIKNNTDLDSINIKTNAFNSRINIEDNASLKKINSYVKSSFMFYIFYNFVPSPDTLIFNNLNREMLINEFDAFGNLIFTGERFRVTRELEIGRNNILTSFNNFNPYVNIDSIEIATLFNFDTFDFKGIENVTHISRLTINTIPELSINSFSNAAINFESLSLANCPSITNLFPFTKCTTASLNISDLNFIESLEGIVYRDTANSIRLNNNKILSDISIVETVDTFTLDGFQGLTFTNNPLLSTCDYEIICKTINNNINSNKITIKDNDGNCKTKELLQQACIVDTDDLIGEISYTYSNKTLDVFNCQNCEYKVIDINGRQLKKGSYIESIDFSLYPTGMYFIHLIKDDNASIIKLFSY